MAIIKIAIIVDEENSKLDFKVARDEKIVPINIVAFKALVENLLAGITPIEERQ